MVKLRRFGLSCPNTGLLFLIAGMAVGNYSYEDYHQKHLNRRGIPSQDSQVKDVDCPGTNGGSSSNNRDANRVTNPHPLDPLSAEEMQYAGRIVKLCNSVSDWQFKFIGLREPDKAVMSPYFKSRTIPPAGLIPRRANVLICDPIIRFPIQVVVNLDTGMVEQWKNGKVGEKVGVITAEDDELAQKIALEDAQVTARLQAKGYNDLSKIVGDVWDAGYVADNPDYSQANKLVQIYYYATGDGDNYYAHPLDFVVTVQLGPKNEDTGTLGLVRGIKELPIQQGFDTSNRQGDSVPTADAEYFSDRLPPNFIIPANHKIQISQPNGPSFTIAGNEVTWQSLNFRIGYNPREGFHIYTVTYNDNGNIRPVIYRLSMSEVYMSYGDPRPPYHRKSSYDIGNGEFGSSLRTLPVHQFCRGNPYYFSSDHHTEKATTFVIENSLCVNEEDAGLLWAHSDDDSGKTEAIRDRRLVLSSLVTYGYVDYFISWRFYKDGTIELGVKVTGILSTNLMAVDVKAPGYGNLMMPQVYAQNYQHFFAARVDADVDGEQNTVSMEDIVRVSEQLDSTNPYGNGITTRSVDLTTPIQAATDSVPNRFWRISNRNNAPSSLNGKYPSWKLIPQGPITPNMLTPDSPLRFNRLTWAQHDMWILPYDIDHIYAGGQFLDCGVNKWTNQSANENIENADVVLYHVFNSIHLPDVEDWPILSSVEPIGFRLRPSNFFSQNPALSSTRAKEATLLDGGGTPPKSFSAHGSSSPDH